MCVFSGDGCVFLVVMDSWVNMLYTDKKENQIFLFYKEIQKASDAND